MKNYEASVKINNDWQKLLKDTQRNCVKTAIKESKKIEVQETDVRGFDENGDITFHCFYKNGKLEINMFN